MFENAKIRLRYNYARAYYYFCSRIFVHFLLSLNMQLLQKQSEVYNNNINNNTCNNLFIIIIIIYFFCIIILLSAWRLAFQVYNGTLYTWDAATIGYGTMWALFMSDVSYTPTDPSSYEPYKSSILQDWEEKKISVQAVIKRTHNVETTFFSTLVLRHGLH